ncbi:MAG: ATP-binding protein [Chloroflexota bacterium]
MAKAKANTSGDSPSTSSGSRPLRARWPRLSEFATLAGVLGLVFFLDLAALPARFATATYIIPVLFAAHRWPSRHVTAVGLVAMAAGVLGGVQEGGTPLGLLIDLLILLSASYLAVRLASQAEIYAQRAREAQQGASTLSALIETLPTAVVVSDVTGALTLTNRAARDLLGENVGDAYGFHGASLCRLDGSPFPAAELPLPRALECGETTAEVQLLLRCGTASERILSAAGAPVRSEAGAVVGAVAVYNEITEQYVVDMALRESEARYRRIVETAGEGVWVLDADHNTRFANQRLAEMLGFTLAELEGQPFLYFVDDESRALGHNHLRSARRGPRQRDFRFRRHDDSVLWAIVSTTPILGVDGAYSGLLAMVTDITERKRAEQTRDEYLGLISHDLRQPLTVILGMAEWLHDGLVRRELAREAGAAERIVKSAQRMSGMIKDLVESERLESGNLVVNKEPVDVPAFLGEAVERLGVEQARVQVEVNGPVAGLLADSARLERALLNLLSNALKYSPSGCPVVVTAAEREEELHIAVRDEGVGIPRAEQSRIFERFYRASTGQRYEGLGLGLYITRLIVEAHGGRIWVESQEGEGSTFHVALPLAAKGAATEKK